MTVESLVYPGPGGLNAAVGKLLPAKVCRQAGSTQLNWLRLKAFTVQVVFFGAACQTATTGGVASS